MRTPTDRVGLSGDSRLTIVGESSVSSDSRRAAAARKSVRAKVDHLPGELAVGASRVACPGIGRDWPADERRFAELYRGSDDASEPVVVAHDARFGEHVAREVRPSVEEGRQQPEDPQVP